MKSAYEFQEEKTNLIYEPKESLNDIFDPVSGVVSISEMLKAYTPKPYVESDQEKQLRIKERQQMEIRCRLHVDEAIENGQLIVPDQCELCGSTVNVFAYHSDYTKPFTVDWLCNTCHRRFHEIKGNYYAS